LNNTGGKNTTKTKIETWGEGSDRERNTCVDEWGQEGHGKKSEPYLVPRFTSRGEQGVASLKESKKPGNPPTLAAFGQL